jgi:hypothetical protein
VQADVQATTVQTGIGCHLCGESFHISKHAFCMHKQTLPSRGQTDATRRSLKQPNAKFPFQGLDLLGESGLRNGDFPGCLGEVQAVCEHHKVVQLPQFHTLLLLIRRTYRVHCIYLLVILQEERDTTRGKRHLYLFLCQQRKRDHRGVWPVFHE